MEDADLATLADRLAGAKLSIDWTRAFAITQSKLARFLTASNRSMIGRASRRRRQATDDDGLWPIHGLQQVCQALLSPTEASMAPLVEFVEAVAIIKHLQAGRKMKRELQRVFPGKLPFSLVALGRVFGRTRALTPRPTPRQEKDLSDVELLHVWRLWAVGQVCHEEILGELKKHAIATVCSYCGLLHLKTTSAYCSDQCRKAFHDEKRYRRLRTKSENA